MSKNSENNLQYTRNIYNEPLSNLKKLCLNYRSTCFVKEIDRLRISVLQKSLLDSILSLEISRAILLLKIMGRRMCMIQTLKQMVFHIKSFVIYTLERDFRYSDQLEKDDLISLYNWLCKLYG
ncbi:hypothetical protein ACR3K2_37570 [Cryptosporidium serpentis]